MRVLGIKNKRIYRDASKFKTRASVEVPASPVIEKKPRLNSSKPAKTEADKFVEPVLEEVKKVVEEVEAVEAAPVVVAAPKKPKAPKKRVEGEAEAPAENKETNAE